MVFHRSLSSSKPPQVSRTLLSILADLNNAVVWMVFARPLISKSASPCTNPLITVQRAPITIGTPPLLSYSTVFSIPYQSPDIYLSFTFIQFYPVVRWDSKISKFCKFSFFILFSFYYNEVIRLYLKIPEKFVSLILQDRFWVEHIPLVRMVKFKFLAQFPVDHFAHPVVSCLILLLGYFSAFVYHVINRFVSTTT